MTVPGPEYIPCGACNALIFADTGCRHWKPGGTGGKKIGWTKGRSRWAVAPDDEQALAQRTVDVLAAGGLTDR